MVHGGCETGREGMVGILDASISLLSGRSIQACFSDVTLILILLL
jgi:hypothetical protein